jgi:hypothetical protein
MGGKYGTGTASKVLPSVSQFTVGRNLFARSCEYVVERPQFLAATNIEIDCKNKVRRVVDHSPSTLYCRRAARLDRSQSSVTGNWNTLRDRPLTYSKRSLPILIVNGRLTQQTAIQSAK